MALETGLKPQIDVGEVAQLESENHLIVDVGCAAIDATLGTLLGSRVLETPISQMGVPKKIMCWGPHP